MNNGRSVSVMANLIAPPPKYVRKNIMPVEVCVSWRKGSPLALVYKKSEQKKRMI